MCSFVLEKHMKSENHTQLNQTRHTECMHLHHVGWESHPHLVLKSTSHILPIAFHNLSSGLFEDKGLCLWYWVGQKVGLVFSIEDTFFTFTSSFYWFGYFECISSLPHGVILSSFNASTWSLSTSADISQWGISRTKLQTISDTFDQSQHLLPTLFKSLPSSCLFTFREMIKRNMLKMLLIFFYL